MYTTMITCDFEGCNSTSQVPQPGALPKGWLVIQFSQVTLNKDLSHGPEQMVQKMLCGWKCCHKLTKSKLGQKESNEK